MRWSVRGTLAMLLPPCHMETRYPCYHVVVIRSFRDSGTRDIFDGGNSRPARKTCPRKLWSVATRKLDQLDSVVSLEELRIPPGN